MLVTLFGIVTDGRLMHKEKAFSPMVVTLLGMNTVVKSLKLLNARFPMLVAPLLIMTEVMETRGEYHGASELDE